jgi:hypothetical protein
MNRNRRLDQTHAHRQSRGEPATSPSFAFRNPADARIDGQIQVSDRYLLQIRSPVIRIRVMN